MKPPVAPPAPCAPANPSGRMFRLPEQSDDVAGARRPPTMQLPGPLADCDPAVPLPVAPRPSPPVAAGGAGLRYEFSIEPTGFGRFGVGSNGSQPYPGK